MKSQPHRLTISYALYYVMAAICLYVNNFPLECQPLNQWFTCIHPQSSPPVPIPMVQVFQHNGPILHWHIHTKNTIELDRQYDNAGMLLSTKACCWVLLPVARYQEMQPLHRHGHVQGRYRDIKRYTDLLKNTYITQVNNGRVVAYMKESKWTQFKESVKELISEFL